MKKPEIMPFPSEIQQFDVFVVLECNGPNSTGGLPFCDKGMNEESNFF